MARCAIRVIVLCTLLVLLTFEQGKSDYQGKSDVNFQQVCIIYSRTLINVFHVYIYNIKFLDNKFLIANLYVLYIWILHTSAILVYTSLRWKIFIPPLFFHSIYISRMLIYTCFKFNAGNECSIYHYSKYLMFIEVLLFFNCIPICLIAFFSEIRFLFFILFPFLFQLLLLFQFLLKILLYPLKLLLSILIQWFVHFNKFSLFQFLFLIQYFHF